MIENPTSPNELTVAAESLAGRRVRSRAVLHIADAIERDLRGGQPRASDDAGPAFESLLAEVEDLAKALDQAAEDLRNAGRIMPANHAKRSAMHARQVLASLRGVEA